MEARDGSLDFDFGGVYEEIRLHEYISYTMDDGRTAQITLASHGSITTITQTFATETENSIELQETGRQAILDHFKLYSERQV
jgi:Activator of Hsp90 ATPase homolog 1-like protein